MLSEAMVAGTVILNKQNGEKEFLVKEESGDMNFLMVPIDSKFTSLACILKELRNLVKLNTKEMELVELTNILSEDHSMPLFVFSLNEVDSTELTETFYWKDASTVRVNVLENVSVSGVPFF